MDEYLMVIKSLSESTRIRILALLQQARQVCVSDMVDVLQESQYNISRHLKVLKKAGLVEGCRKGRWIYYQLSQSEIHFKNALLKAISHISSDVLKEDMERLKQKMKMKIEHECKDSS